MDNDFNRWRVETNEEGSYDSTMDWTGSELWWKDNNWKKRKRIGMRMKSE